MRIKRSVQGGIWLFALILYFIFFIGIKSTVNLGSEMDISSYQTELDKALEVGGFCASPRGFTDPSSHAYYETYEEVPSGARFSYRWNLFFSIYPNMNIENDFRCEYSVGNNISDACSLENCSWSGTECEGDINFTYYNVELAEGGAGASKDPFCESGDFYENESLCMLAACRWVDKGSSEFYQMIEDNTNSKNIISGITEIFSVSMTFNTGSTILDYIMNFLFLIMPTIIMVIALYFTVMPGK